MQAAYGVFRFGVFEADRRTGELRKQGTKLRLPRQSFEVLILLLERPGELVAREELRAKLWPADTFVDFDHGLNAAVNRLREALGDSAEIPRFVATLPRRGYRFIASVESPPPQLPDIQPALGAPPQAKFHSGPLSVGSSAAPRPHPPESPVGRLARSSPTSAISGVQAKKIWRWAIAAVGTSLLVGAAIWFHTPAESPRVIGSVQLTHEGKNLCCVVTDGSRIYFNEEEGGESMEAIAQASLNGGPASIIPAPVKDLWILDISPDHSQLLVGPARGDYSPLWALPVAAGAPRRVGDISANPGRAAVTYSRDGQKLVFAKGRDIWIASSDGQNLTRVVFAPGPAAGTAFSPDGKRIRFTVADSFYSRIFSLWEVNSDGSNLHQLLKGWHNPPQESGGFWTHDGRYYVFESHLGRQVVGQLVGDIFVLPDVSGIFHKSASQPIQLTFGPVGYNADAITPDDKKLLAEGVQSRGELVRYDPGSKQFLPFLGGMPITDVAYSRDGKWIAYVSLVDDTLWRSRSDGSERIQLTYLPDQAGLPRWSPEGGQIVYMSLQSRKVWKMLLVSAQGGTPELLVPGSTNESDPTWSADGTQLAFGTGDPGSSEIRILDMKTRQVSTILGSAGLFSSRWSPDGRYLVAQDLTASFNTKFLLYDFQTRKWSNWVNDPDGVGNPVWTSDSRYVDYISLNSTWKRVQLGDTHPQVLFSFKGLPWYWGNFGPWTGNASDNTHLLVRDVSTPEIYALDVDFP